MADQSVQFISKTELNAKKEEKRKAREQLLQQAKAEFEREERRREKRKAAGEDTWMLPSVSDRIADDDDEHRKKRKRKKEKKTKDKKNKKNKKNSKKEKDISSDSDSDEWVEKDSGETGDVTKPEEKDTTTAPERDGWMLFPCFSERSKSSPINQQEQRKLDEEIEDKNVPAIDVLGQHSKELNPYWKDGGKGLPTQKEETTKSNSDTSTTLYDVRWLKKSLQRSKEQAEEEGRSLEEVVADRWESLEHLESLITEAELSQRNSEKQHSYSRDRSDRKDFRESSWKRDNNRQGRYRESDRYSSHRDCDNTRRDTRYHDRRDRDKDKHDNYDKDYEYKRTRDHDKSVNKERPHNDNVEYNKREHKSADIQNRHGCRTVNPFKRPDSGARDSKSSSKFIKPSDDSSSPSSFPSKPGSTSQGWRKKTAQENPKVNRIELAMKKHQEKSQQDSSSDSSDSEDDHDISEESKTEVPVSSDIAEAEPVKRVIPAKKITEADLNSIGAKILKAEIMGNEDQAAELKASLEQMRVDKEAQESATSTNKEPREQEVVLLTRTDKFGNTRPVSMNEMQEPKRGRRKREKATTHDDSGQRERYFADDDRYDLNEIVRREKMNSAEDYNSMFSRLASKGASKTDSDDFTLDDHFVTGAANKYSKAKEEEREKMKAIKEHQRMSSQLSKCRFCFENPDLAKHLIIAIGIKVYLAVPLHTSLTEGHCLIIPMQHQVAYTYLDEDVIDEIKVFKKGLTKMFQEMDKDVIFLETCRNLSRQHHMIIECIPVPKEEGDLAPMYFKKAILESDSEWAHNKKLIDTSKKGLIGSIPRGLPYFSVEFALDGGFAHVVEEEHLFPQYFGKEIIGGMLDLEPWTWHKPHRENFEQHKNKVLQFADWWKPYDWTKRLAKAK